MTLQFLQFKNDIALPPWLILTVPLLEAIGLFSDKAEPYFLFRATNCHFQSRGLELKLHKGHVIWKILS